MALHDPFWYRCGFLRLVADDADDPMDDVKVVDGDTAAVELQLGFYLTATLRIRLMDINTPEIRGTTGEEHARALAAAEYTRAWFSRFAGESPQHLGHPFWVRTEKAEKYGRWLGTITSQSGRSLNNDLIIDGHAVIMKTPRGTW